MLVFMKVNVSMAKIKAWIIPTKISKIINGSGIIKGIKKAITRSNTSPAKMLPKRRKENDRIFAASDIISKKPRMNFMGDLKFINFPRYPKTPRNFKENIWIAKTETNARATVVFKSLFGDLKRGSLALPIFT